MHVLKIFICFLSLQVIFQIQTSLIAQTKKVQIVSKTATALQQRKTPASVSGSGQQAAQHPTTSALVSGTVLTTSPTTQPVLTPGGAQAVQELSPDLQALLLGGQAGLAPVSGGQPVGQTEGVLSQPTLSPLSPVSTAPPQISVSAEQAKLLEYKQKIATITSKTDVKQQQQIITDFITEILDTALTSKQTTITTLQDIENVLISVIVDLKTLIASLRSMPKMSDRINATTIQITLLSNKKDDVVRKIAQLNKVMSLFAAARKISIDNLHDKVSEYLLLLAQITQDVPDFYIQEFIKDLYTLVTAARGQEEPKIIRVKQLLDQTTTNKALSKDQLLQIQGFVSILTGQAITKAPQTKIVSPEDLKNKLADIQKKPTLFEKITTSQEALTLMSDTTAQSEKNTLVNFLKDFMLALPTMKKAELAELRNLFDAASKNPFLLAANQQPIMDRWLKIVTQALLTIDNVSPLLTSVKPLLDPTKDDYSSQLSSCNLAVVLATSNTPASEMDLKNSASLAAKIRAKIYFLYINRGNKSYDDLTTLKNIFTLAKQVPTLASLITPQWENTLTLDRALSSAGTKKSVLDQLQDFQTIIQLLSDKTDAYERQTFLTVLTNIFTSRKDRAIIELEKFQDFLSSMIIPAFVSKKIFDKQTNDQIATWQKILNCTLQLLATNNQTSLQDSIKTYLAILPTIALPQADYEKSLFGDVLARLFSMRSALENSDLNLLKIFFETVKKTPNLLAPNQLTTFNLWLQDLENATTVTATTATATTPTGTTTYLDALITTAGQKLDLTMFSKALALFTASTSTDTRNNFVAALNTLFTQRQKLDVQKLLAFFKIVEQKKIGKDPLLSPAQLAILKQWESILTGAPVV